MPEVMLPYRSAYVACFWHHAELRGGFWWDCGWVVHSAAAGGWLLGLHSECWL